MKTSMFIVFAVLIAGILAPRLVQAQGTLEVSSLGGTPTGSLLVGSDAWVAQYFSTGSNPNGYVLNSVQLLMDPAQGNPSGFAVSIYSSGPGSSLGTLSGSDDPVAGGVYDYTASDLTLLPSTDYLVVVTATTPIAEGAYEWSYVNSRGSSYEAYWDIPQAYLTSVNGSSWISSAPEAEACQLAIYATAIPVPEPGTLALLAAGLACFGFWRYRANRH